MKVLTSIVMIILLISMTRYASAADTIGYIQTLQGTATIQRGKLTLPVSIGTVLYREDLLRTSKPGAVGIVLADDTNISMGPNSEISFKEYEFNPKEGKFSLIVRMARGTFAYLSGLIGKLSPDSVKLSIPDATIATRGTKLLIVVNE